MRVEGELQARAEEKSVGCSGCTAWMADVLHVRNNGKAVWQLDPVERFEDGFLVVCKREVGITGESCERDGETSSIVGPRCKGRSPEDTESNVASDGADVLRRGSELREET